MTDTQKPQIEEDMVALCQRALTEPTEQALRTYAKAFRLFHDSDDVPLSCTMDAAAERIAELLRQLRESQERTTELERLLRSTGIKDKNGREICEGDSLKFILAFPTEQTHTGDNIPRGSYTEPDEPFVHWVTGEVYWDEDRGMWSISPRSDEYGLDQCPSLLDLNSDYLPVINRDFYSLQYLRSLCQLSWERLCDCGDCFILEQLKCRTWDEVEAVMNTIEVVALDTTPPTR